MTQEQKDEITRISKEFAAGFDFALNGSGWLIVDPLSAYLSFGGYENTLEQLPATNDHPQVLIMTFSDGSQFIPAGADLKSIYHDAENFCWI